MNVTSLPPVKTETELKLTTCTAESPEIDKIESEQMTKVLFQNGYCIENLEDVVLQGIST